MAHLLTQDEKRERVMKAIDMIQKGDEFSLVSLKAKIDGSTFPRWQADGVMVRTDERIPGSRLRRKFIFPKLDEDAIGVMILDLSKSKKVSTVKTSIGPQLPLGEKMDILRSMQNDTVVDFFEKMGIHLKNPIMEILRENKHLKDKRYNKSVLEERCSRLEDQNKLLKQALASEMKNSSKKLLQLLEKEV